MSNGPHVFKDQIYDIINNYEHVTRDLIDYFINLDMCIKEYYSGSDEVEINHCRNVHDRLNYYLNERLGAAGFESRLCFFQFLVIQTKNRMIILELINLYIVFKEIIMKPVE